VSYKFHDRDVAPLVSGYCESITREYVNALETQLLQDHIYKGESADEPLGHLTDETIRRKLYDRIYDSTATLILISPNMREEGIPESEQWMAQEISYSLSEHSRGGTTSHTNAMLAIILPESDGSYDYYSRNRRCCTSGCKVFLTSILLPIHKANMLNKDNGKVCEENIRIYEGEHSFIPSVTWNDFLNDSEGCLLRAYEILEEIDEYTITKQLN